MEELNKQYFRTQSYEKITAIKNATSYIKELLKCETTEEFVEHLSYIKKKYIKAHKDRIDELSKKCEQLTDEEEFEDCSFYIRQYNVALYNFEEIIDDLMREANNLIKIINDLEDTLFNALFSQEKF